jgi:large subunit ribosomal protein L21
MFAIVTIAGQQFKVEEGQEIFVHRLEAQAGDSVSFDAVHLLASGEDVSVGTPMLSGASVGATVLDPLVKGDKITIFKKKRRKGYKLKKGHRQQFTKLKINSIAG